MRGWHGASEEMEESRFLSDIPNNLVSGQPRVERHKLFPSQSRSREDTADTRNFTNTKYINTQPSPSRPAKIIEQIYRAGTRITHPVWGDGIVLDSRVQDGDEIVDVVFASAGIKRLAASLAKLTIIK